MLTLNMCPYRGGGIHAVGDDQSCIGSIGACGIRDGADGHGHIALHVVPGTTRAVVPIDPPRGCHARQNS